MGEAHARAELDQARGLGGRQCVDRNAQLRRSAQEQGCVADRFGRRDQQQALGLRRERLGCDERNSSSIAAVDERFPEIQKPPANSVAVMLRGTSSMASGTPRVSATMRSRTRGSMPPSITDSSRSRAASSDRPLTADFRQPGQHLGSAVAGGEDQGDRFGQQSPGHEGEGLHGHLVEPLRVVDDAEQRSVGAGGGHQAQHGQPDQESGRGWVRPVRPNATFSASRWGSGSSIEVIDQRRTQLLEAGEGQLHVGLHARHVDAAESLGLLREVGEQRGFSDTCLAAEHQHLAAARSDGRYQTPKRLAFAVATAKTDPPTLARHRLHRMCLQWTLPA